MRLGTRVGLLLIVLTMCGCASLFPKPGDRPDLGVLAPTTALTPVAQTLPTHLAIDIPYGGAAYDTSRIPIAKNTSSLDYLAGVEWTDRIPFLVQNAVVRAFENSGGVQGVARAASGINPDALLMLDIRKFRLETSHPQGHDPRVSVEVCAKIVSMATRKIANQCVLKEQASLPSLSLPDVVKAFNETLGRILDRLVIWTLEEPALSKVFGPTERNP